jgi:uncharacterized protein (TIGR02001 family)
LNCKGNVFGVKRRTLWALSGRYNQLVFFKGEIMRRILAIGMFVMLGGASAAQAGITGTVTAVSDYDFRGYTQTGKDPALQGSIDFSMDNGFYAGAWSSTSLDFGPGTDANVELDIYAGFTGGKDDGLKWSLNAVEYTYPGATDFNFPEISAGISYKLASAKLWYSWDFANTSMDAWYLEGNLNFAMPQDYGFVIHAGYSGGDYWNSFDGKYLDWALGVTKSFGHFDTSLKYIDTSGAVYDHTADAFSAKGKLLLSIATTFPWAK